MGMYLLLKTRHSLKKFCSNKRVYIYIWMLLNALMMEVVRTSETSLNFNVTTRRYIPEDSKLYLP
jgi:hypothetical protein